MTYAISSALQSALYQHLIADAGLVALIGSNVFDAPPTGVIPQTYVLIGDELARDKSSKTSAAAVHEFTINVVSDLPGFTTAKQVAGAVCDGLIDADIPLARGRLVALNFVRARALREDSPGIRQIDLRFHAFVEDD